MSKVAIQGNASGTGTLTIAAPSTNTDRTLTLPDEAGTVLTSGGAIDVSASAPADSVAIDSSGNVGIGTSSPSAKLDVAGPASVTSFTGTTQLGVTVRGSSSTNDYSGIDIIGGNLTTPVARIAALTTGGGSTLSFGTSNSYASGITNTAMTLDASGNFMVGKTSAGDQQSSGGGLSFNVASGDSGYLSVVQTSSTTGNSCIYLNRNRNTGYMQYFMYNNTGIGNIANTGTSVAYNTSYDYRLKNTIAPMTGALAKVALLKPCTYKWNADGSDGEGFIAHELAEVVPQCVTGEKDAVDAEGNPQYQGIDTSFLIATLTAAIQEQQALITAQQAAIETLEARVAALEGN